MRLPVSFRLALLVLWMGPGCPLDIQVRDEADAGCAGQDCVLACLSDRECPEGQRCNDAFGQCEPGTRLTEPCADSFSCPSLAFCREDRCTRPCSSGCPSGYLCGPESQCVEACQGMPPESLGRFCQGSLECTRCGFCADTGGVKKCHQPCQADAECPGGEPGVCQLIPGSTLRVCRLP